VGEVVQLLPDIDDVASIVCPHCSNVFLFAAEPDDFAVYCPECSKLIRLAEVEV
jgi:uncharacterized Zn-finger protein